MVISAGISACFQGRHAHSPPAVRLQVWVDLLAIVRVGHSSSLCCLSGLYLLGQNVIYLTVAASAPKVCALPLPLTHILPLTRVDCCSGDQCNAIALVVKLSSPTGLRVISLPPALHK